MKIRGWRIQIYAVPRDELALIIRQPRLGLFGISRSPRRRLPLRSRPHGQRPSAIGNHPPRCQTEPGSDLEVGWRLLWSCLLPDSLGGSRVCPWARLTRAAANDQLLAGDRQRPQFARSSQSHTAPWDVSRDFGSNVFLPVRGNFSHRRVLGPMARQRTGTNNRECPAELSLY